MQRLEHAQGLIEFQPHSSYLRVWHERALPFPPLKKSFIFFFLRNVADWSPSETRVHRRSLHLDVNDGGGSRQKHSSRMSCDLDVRDPGNTQPTSRPQQPQQPRQKQRHPRMALSPDSLEPSMLAPSTAALMINDSAEVDKEDEENVERGRKDSGINSSSKVSSDADQSSGAHVLLSDQETCVAVNDVLTKQDDEVGEDPSSDVKTNSSAPTSTTVTIETSQAPALPKKEGKRSRVRITRFEDDGKTTSFDSVSSSAGGDDGSAGGIVDGVDFRGRRSEGESSAKETWDSTRERESAATLSSSGSVRGGSLRNRGGEGELRKTPRGANGGGGERMRLRNVRGGGSFETGSVGNLGITSVEAGSRSDGGGSMDEEKSKSVGNVFRQFRGGRNFEELDFRSEAAVRLFQSCCDDEDREVEASGPAHPRYPQRSALSPEQQSQRQPPSQPRHQPPPPKISQQYPARPVPQAQRRLSHQPSRESQSSDCISGSSLVRRRGLSPAGRPGGERGSGEGEESTLSFSRRADRITSRPLLRLNSDEGPQPPSSSSASASLSRLCSSQEVVGARGHPVAPMRQHPRDDPGRAVDASRSRAAGSISQPARNASTIDVGNEGPELTRIQEQRPMSPADHGSRPARRGSSRDREGAPRQHHSKERKRRSNPEGAVERPTVLMDSSAWLHPVGDGKDRLRSPMTSSVPAALPLVCSSSALPFSSSSVAALTSSSSSALRISANNASSPANPEEPPPFSSRHVVVVSPSSSLANQVAGSVPPRHVIVPSLSSPHYHPHSHHLTSDVVSPLLPPPPPTSFSGAPANIIFSSSHVSEEDLAHYHYRHRRHHHHYHLSDHPPPRRHYHLSTSSPSRPPAGLPPHPLTNGYTSSYLLDESADSPSALFLDNEDLAKNDPRNISWRRSFDM